MYCFSHWIGKKIEILLLYECNARLLHTTACLLIFDSISLAVKILVDVLFSLFSIRFIRIRFDKNALYSCFRFLGNEFELQFAKINTFQLLTWLLHLCVNFLCRFLSQKPIFVPTSNAIHPKNLSTKADQNGKKRIPGNKRLQNSVAVMFWVTRDKNKNWLCGCEVWAKMCAFCLWQSKRLFRTWSIRVK